MFAVKMGGQRSQESALPDEVFQELVDQLFAFPMGVATGVVMLGSLGLMVLLAVGGRLTAVLMFTGMTIGIARLVHTLVYRTLREKGAFTRRENERWDLQFGTGSVAFSLHMGLLASIALIPNDAYLNSIGYAMCFAYGCGNIVRNGFRARAAVLALVALTLPVFACIAIDWLQVPTLTRLALDGQLALLLLSLVLGGVYTAQAAQTMAEERLVTRRNYFALAHSDPLTGAANRLRLREAFDEAVCGGRPLALHCLDLDRFKPVNDRLGHAAGDALLMAVTERLRALLRRGDTLARTGGDEFAILQCGPLDESDVDLVSRRVVDAIRQPFAIAGEIVEIGTSIGSVRVVPGSSLDEACLLADRRLYQDKARNRRHDRGHLRAV